MNEFKVKIGPIFLLSCFFAVLTAFYLFVFNSDYGYDGLEFLVIGRSLHDGYSLFSFTPHKPWALYYLVSGFLFLGNLDNHYGVSLLITTIFGLMLTATFYILRKVFDQKTALLGCFFVSLSAIFMELNFLLAEGFVYLSGILSFYCIVNALRKDSYKGLLSGGFLIGVGSWFKVVSATYFIAVILFLFFLGHQRGERGGRRDLRKQFFVFLGFLAALLVPVLYFSVFGSLREYLLWTYFFPLFKFASSTEWFYKMYTKLPWFFMLLFFIFFISLRKEIRSKIYRNSSLILLLCLGIFPLVLLFKLQAPHYLFPGAGFLSIFIAVVIGHITETRQRRIFVIMGSLALLSMLMMSVLLHSPKRLDLSNLLRLRDYSREKEISSIINKYVPRGENAIFFRDSAFLYWITRRYPNIPFLWFDNFATYAMKKSPELLLDALSDPRLALVEFNPESLGLYDMKEIFLKNTDNQVILEEFYGKLRTHFTALEIDLSPYRFWIRKIVDSGVRSAQ